MILIVITVGLSLPFYLILPFYSWINMQSPTGVLLKAIILNSEIALMTFYQLWMLGELLWLFRTHEKRVKTANTAVKDSFKRLIWKTFAQALFRYGLGAWSTRSVAGPPPELIWPRRPPVPSTVGVPGPSLSSKWSVLSFPTTACVSCLVQRAGDLPGLDCLLGWGESERHNAQHTLPLLSWSWLHCPCR